MAGDRWRSVSKEARTIATFAIDKTLRQFPYRHLGKRERGIIRRLLARITGYSPATLSRLIQQSRQCGPVRQSPRRTTQGFHRIYTAADIRLLA